MGSAQLNTTTLDPARSEAASHCYVAAPPASPDALRVQVVERLAAHRSRRSRAHTQTQLPIQLSPALSSAPAHSAPTRSARIAAAVAERYAHSPTYRAFLAAEAERATQQAQAAAEVAALNARAVAAAQQQLLDALQQDARDDDARNEDARNDPDDSQQVLQAESKERLTVEHEPIAGRELQPAQDAVPVEWTGPTSSQPAASATASVPSRREGAAPLLSSSTPPAAGVGLTIRLYEDAAVTTLFGASHRSIGALLPVSSFRHGNRHEDRNDAEARALDEEIAFRQSPIFEEPAGPTVPLPANLIEFPRQLVASRKSRPRLAEGPLREDADAAPARSQLRIFEVDAAQISTTPIPDDTSTPPWTSIWLDAPGAPPMGAGAAIQHAPEQHDADGLAASCLTAVPFPQAAPIGRRFMAAAVNACIILTGFLAFAAAFILAAIHWIPWQRGASLHLILDRAAGFLAAQTGLQTGMVLVSSAIAISFFYLLYHVLFFSFSDATPGMRCARIALCTFADENPTRSALRCRIFAILLSACPLGLGFLWATLDEDRLSVHDRISRMYQRSY